MPELVNIGAATLGGILPALAWLWFWRREDSKHPEPRKLIALAFFMGMVTIAVVIPIEKYVASFITEQQFLLFSAGATTTLIFSAWSAIEEVTKYAAARFTVLRRREYDEPIDPVIYMVTVALGFAAVENALFLMSPLAGTTLVQTVRTGNLRFVGATLLHVLSSAVIGVTLGLSFYMSPRQKRWYVVIGVILAVLLHSAFNFLILNTPEARLLQTFALVWIGLVVLLAVLEWVKRTGPRRR